MSLRNGRVQVPTATSSMAAQSASSEVVPRTRPSPYLLLMYPVIIALGSAFYYISPIANSRVTPHAAPLTPGIVSDQHASALPHTLSYFADKRNVFNLYFVKIGWFWTTLAFLLLPLTTSPRPKVKYGSERNHLIPAYLRYVLVTVVWVFTTKWFFGPALTDRSFTLTGGHCEAITPLDSVSPEAAARLNKLPAVVSAIACKAEGGHWRGGHDISGHAFMLVLSSAFLIYELVIADSLSAHPSISPTAAANLSKELSEDEKKAVGGWESEGTAKMRVWVRRFVYAVISLDLWMLMMTAVFFHTWLEKLSGLAVAGGAIWSVYHLSEFVPAWGQVVGL